MLFRVDITDRAQLDIDDLARYCRNYAAAFWEEQEARLSRVFETWLATTPHTWNFFFVTGAPYRAYLFEIGDRTKYWIVYTIDENAKVVNVLRVWNTTQDPDRFHV
jgi:plasmid stabilization system protein ParE